MGLRLRGDNFEGRYVIADIRMKNPVPVERFALFETIICAEFGAVIQAFFCSLA